MQEEFEFIDSQQLQEYPEELPPGQTPRSFELINVVLYKWFLSHAVEAVL
ncbi:MAG: hypothetical protein JSV57_05865 [Candidatus Bathyarchaeota archaeon]|nr:MAG: hypothetical protein JSV57_05865 [Candidatus Bathyarchaeota archaeon]